MEAFDVLGDPVRRRILEHLAHGERSAGDVAALVGEEFGISQPAVSQHLRVLRTHGFATVRPDGARRLYALDPAPLGEVEDWAAGLRRFWEQRLDALGTELARGARDRRRREAAERAGSTSTHPQHHPDTPRRTG
ncbi:ArsR/SmtB family transcription factor [Cellulosimicrobium marinum]|uniref:ArsR/SmtB family transcription factor n=1 Tax=Cellulosimicrobium marinum TaxID=1638992 RepID=UPI001E5F6C92|nr:metalloregulator ArsR/SmtB family transcription factor [Cellulosimicrobium marinum]MCB7137104.1 metalloregulator ArsR/SmtB family transcription factor [Cellulosimicrobium marinum]